MPLTEVYVRSRLVAAMEKKLDGLAHDLSALGVLVVYADGEDADELMVVANEIGELIEQVRERMIELSP